jgi:hypothetical protein
MMPSVKMPLNRPERVTLAKILADMKDMIRHKRLDSALIITVKHPGVLMSVWLWLCVLRKDSNNRTGVSIMVIKTYDLSINAMHPRTIIGIC